jgi:hypothetical protein
MENADAECDEKPYLYFDDIERLEMRASYFLRSISAGDGFAGVFSDLDEDIHGEVGGKTHSIPMQSEFQGRQAARAARF